VAEDLGLVELRGVRGQDVIEARRGQVQRIAVDVAAGRERAGEESPVRWTSGSIWQDVRCALEPVEAG